MPPFNSSDTFLELVPGGIFRAERTHERGESPNDVNAGGFVSHCALEFVCIACSRE
jgi:hypothetical protein